MKTYCVDLTDFVKLRAVMEGLPVMDGVVNNAGVGMHAPFLEATEEQASNARFLGDADLYTSEYCTTFKI